MHRIMYAALALTVALPMATIGDGDSPAEATTTLAPAWHDDVAAACDTVGATLSAIPAPSSAEDLARYIEAHVPARDALVASLGAIELPPELSADPYDVMALVRDVDALMTRAMEQLAAGNIDGTDFSDTAFGSIDRLRLLIFQIATMAATAGVRCGGADPARAAEAVLNIPILAAWQVTMAYDSIWVSDRANRQVHRIDPGTGATAATIAMGSLPIRLQPADGRMVVRTADAYEFIDPATNMVVAMLPKSEVGPGANRAWAVDGALWICDDQRLQRYDPLTLQRVVTIELGFACGNVHATDDLVIPWSYNEDPGESGSSVAAIVDPKTNTVVSTTPLPVDVGKPTVIEGQVFFPATEGATSVVIDRVTGTIVATPNLGRPYVHSNDSAYDGRFLYVVVEGRDVAVIDPASFAIVETIEPMDFDPPLGVQTNALALGPGALWVVNDESGVLQRFDIGP